MASSNPLPGQRRGERVMIRIPVEISIVSKDGRRIDEPAETVVVSKFGALLRVSEPPKQDSTIELKNAFTRQAEKFRVVWLSDKPKEGKYDVGIEILAPCDDFWGVRFPEPPQRR